MTLIATEGFDHLAATDFTNKGWSVNWTGVTTGRFGGQSATINGNSGSRRAKQLPSTYQTLIVGFAIKVDALSTGADFFEILSGGGTTVQLGLQFDSFGRILVKNNGGTTIATGTTVLAANTWYYIEVKLFVNGASGTVEVHLGGQTEIASTVGNFGSTNVDTVGWIRHHTTIASTTIIWVDDVYVCDATGSNNHDFLGEVWIQTFEPDADGAHTDFSRSTGSTNFQNVDDATPDDDTTYNFSSTVGNIDTFGTPAALDPGAAVYGVQVVEYARKDNTGERQIAPVIRQAGTDYVGSNETLLSNYQFLTQIYNQDPTNSNWTATNINADEFGYKLVT